MLEKIVYWIKPISDYYLITKSTYKVVIKLLFLKTFIEFGLFIIIINSLVDFNRQSMTSSFFNPLLIYGRIRNKCINEQISSGRSFLNENVDISGCFFARTLQLTGNGGIINVESGSFSMRIISTMFFNCLCSLNGGAIFFNSKNSSMRMICAYRCSSSTMYHFATICATGYNTIDYQSITSCSFLDQKSYSFHINGGNQQLDNTNSSMNTVSSVSGICTESPSTFTSSHCTLSNNKASTGICIYTFSNSGEFSSSNIISNNGPTYGVIHSNGSPHFNYCIFAQNQDILFYSFGYGTMKLSNCIISHSYVLTTSSPISTFNTTLSLVPSYQIAFFKSHFCYADNEIKFNSKTLNHQIDIPFQRNSLFVLFFQVFALVK